MELAKLLKYVNKYNIDDPKGREDKRHVVKKVIDFTFATVALRDDVFNLYNNVSEVVKELADDDSSFDAKRGKRSLQDVLSYPEVVRYVSRRFDEMETDEDGTELDEEDILTLCEGESTDDSSEDSETIYWALDRMAARISANSALILGLTLVNLAVNVFNVYVCTRGAAV